VRNNIVIDDDLLKEAFSVSRARTKKDLIHEAPKELVRLRKRKDLTELRALTIKSSIDCCIAQIAIEAGALLLHKDKDFSKIANIRPLGSEYFD